MKYTRKWRKGVKKPQQSKELPTFIRIFFIFLTVAKSILGAMDLRSQGFPFRFEGRATEMDEWDSVTFNHPDFAFR